MTTKTFEVKDISLSVEGKKKIEWAEKDMPVLRTIKKDFKDKKPLKGITISACLHVTAETANLAITLKEGGANVFQIPFLLKMMLLLPSQKILE